MAVENTNLKPRPAFFRLGQGTTTRQAKGTRGLRQDRFSVLLVATSLAPLAILGQQTAFAFRQIKKLAIIIRSNTITIIRANLRMSYFFPWVMENYVSIIYVQYLCQYGPIQIKALIFIELKNFSRWKNTSEPEKSDDQRQLEDIICNTSQWKHLVPLE